MTATDATYTSTIHMHPTHTRLRLALPNTTIPAGHQGPISYVLAVDGNGLRDPQITVDVIEGVAHFMDIVLEIGV